MDSPSASNFHPEVGSCRLILGPMFSGKSTRLREEITQSADAGMKVLLINHSDDIRSTEAQDQFVTTHHSGFKGLSEKVTAIRTSQLGTVDIDSFDAIGVDEGQFFDDLEAIVRSWVIDKCKIVIVASLDGDYMMRPFGKAHNLICICDPGNVVKLGAICINCKKQTIPYRRIVRVPAGFTAKIQVEPRSSYVQKEVGGKDKFVPLCMKCYKEHMISMEPVVSLIPMESKITATS